MIFSSQKNVMLTRGEQDEHHERHLDVDGEHHGERKHKTDDGAPSVHEAEPQQFPDGLQVGRHLGHEVPRTFASVEAGVECGEMGKNAFAQVGLHLVGHPEHDAPHGKRKDPGNQAHEGIAGTVGQKPVPGHGAVNEFIECEPEDEGQAHTHPDRGNNRQASRHDSAPVRPQVVKQAVGSRVHVRVETALQGTTAGRAQVKRRARNPRHGRSLLNSCSAGVYTGGPRHRFQGCIRPQWKV